MWLNLGSRMGLLFAVPDVLGFAEIDDGFRYVGGVVGEALQALGHRNQVQRA